MKKMIEAIGKALYGWIVWIGCLTVGESWGRCEERDEGAQ